MKNKFLIVFLVGLFIFPANNMLPLAHAEMTKVPRSTPVHLRLTHMVSSETAHIGDTVNFEVVRDVKIDGKTVISAGSVAEGNIVSAEERGFLGEAGSVAIALRNVTAVDGQTVHLRSTLHREGDDKQTLALVLGVVLCLLFLFIKGKEAELGPGYEVKAYVDDAVTVNALG